MSWQKFTYRFILFVIPIVTGVIIIEALVRNIPNSINTASIYLEQEHESINYLVLSASQNQKAINPEYLSKKTLLAAGAAQNYKVDYYLLKGLHKKLPQLQKIMLGCTYRHFETPPQPKNYWKYRSHLLYYDVNAFDRPVYFKDRLIYLGSPNFYSDQLQNYYIENTKPIYNKYGFQLSLHQDRFAQMKYNKNALEQSYNPKYTRRLDKKFIAYNISWLNKIIAYCEQHNIEIVFTKTPTYENYRNYHITDILLRRDSILNSILTKNPHTLLFDQEESPKYKLIHYLNENHLNPAGAEIFTKKLDTFIQKQQ